MSIELEPVGVFHCAAKHPYDAPRQPGLAPDSTGRVELFAGKNYEQALQDLDGFSRIWLIFLFDRNTNWKPLVQPPRTEGKRGVFATRAPHRPNPIGLSCVELRSVSGRNIEVGAHDLLDGTPILDIKPYVPYADSFPDAACGWLDAVGEDTREIAYASRAEEQIAWLEAHGVDCMRAFIDQQLRERPTDASRKRLRELSDGEWEIAYRTWRAVFALHPSSHQIEMLRILSGYSEEDLRAEHDPYSDKSVHREFGETFGA